MINRLLTYSRFVKIEHSVFALPMILAGALLGVWPMPYTPPAVEWMAREIGWILAAGVAAGTVGFALNRIIDRRIDAENPRTTSRELPAGKMGMREAYGIVLAATAVYFFSAYRISPICVMLAPLPLLVFFIYPFLKRFTAFAHIGVGLSLALGPLGAGLAITSNLFVNQVARGAAHQIPLRLWPKLTLFFLESIKLFPGFALSIFTFFWVIGFDIIYATMDEEFDVKHGLHSLPARLGRRRALRVSAALHAAAFVSLLGLYVSYFRTPVAGVVLSAAGVLLFLEQYKSQDVNLAFFKINGILSFLVLGFICAGVARR